METQGNGVEGGKVCLSPMSYLSRVYHVIAVHAKLCTMLQPVSLSSILAADHTLSNQVYLSMPVWCGDFWSHKLQYTKNTLC